MIVRYVEENLRITAAEAAEILGLRSSRTRDILQKMVNEGLLEKAGDKRYTYYVRRQP